MEPLVSVVIPVYNATKYLARTLDSALRQTHKNLEIILIDDCSKDDSLKMMYDYAARDSRIKVLESEKNQGVAAVRNRGIQEATGEYIALLDSDDVWVEDKIERQIKLLKENNAQIAYSSYSFIDENDQPIMHPFIVPEETTYKQMLCCNDIGCSTAMVDATIFKKHPFNKEFYHEDYVLWMELLGIPVKAVGITDVLVNYRYSSGSRSFNKVNAAKQRWIIYRNALNMNLIKSSTAMLGYMFNAFKKYRK
ncbi:MAG: glycosyltransferase family 2 protein [Clostridia bacterium]|nr:glycosyltransferase family 2 protein [Clostridia bacterium]